MAATVISNGAAFSGIDGRDQADPRRRGREGSQDILPKTPTPSVTEMATERDAKDFTHDSADDESSEPAEIEPATAPARTRLQRGPDVATTQ